MIGTRYCVHAECSLFLCVHVYSAEDTASRFQPLIHCHNSESRKNTQQLLFIATIQSRGKKALASGFVWSKLSITGAELEFRKQITYNTPLIYSCMACIVCLEELVIGDNQVEVMAFAI